MGNFILSIDAGTTSSRAVLFDRNGTVVEISQHEFGQYFPQKNWVEHDAVEIWQTQLRSIKEVIQRAAIQAQDICAIGIANQRETTVIWDRATGIPVHPAIVWQDKRTANFCQTLREAGKSPLFYDRTGLMVDAYFSGSKIVWILESDQSIRKKAERGELAFGTIDSWLVWNLTQGKLHLTDVTNASRTLLFNIHTLQWDDELIALLNIPRAILPRVVDSSEVVGETHSSLFGVAIPIGGIVGDQQASLFGQLCIAPGDIKNTYGTGSFCMMNTGDQAVVSSNRLLTTIAWKIGDQVTYALEGSVFVSGALIQWLRDQLRIIESATEVEQLALSVTDNGGITFLPALAGLGAPYWDPYATGAIMGITRDTERGHIARAALEAIALMSRDVFLGMQKDTQTIIKALKVDGGASNNNLLMQIQSNLLKIEVIRPVSTEATALGAAFLAGLAVGYWSSLDALKAIWKADQQFFPVPEQEIQSHRIIDLWERRIQKILSTVDG